MQNNNEMFEEEKEKLKKTMTVKMLKKKEALTVRLQKEAQQETASLVKKHSEQMLDLLRSKQEELQNELVEEIVRPIQYFLSLFVFRCVVLLLV